MSEALLRTLEETLHQTTYLDLLTLAQEKYVRIPAGVSPAAEQALTFRALPEDQLWFFFRGKARCYDYQKYVELLGRKHPRCEACGCLEFGFWDEVPRVYRHYELLEDGSLLVDSDNQEFIWDDCTESKAVCDGCEQLLLDLKFDFS